MLSLPLAFQGILIAACAYASCSDAWHRRIPNWLCATTAIAGLLVAFSTGDLQAVGSHALHAAIALVIGMLLFKFGALGGGDAKFYAAVAAWFALDEALRLFVAVSISGVVLLLAWIVIRRTIRAIGKNVRTEGDFAKLPYGVAISVGAILAKTAF